MIYLDSFENRLKINDPEYYRQFHIPIYSEIKYFIEKRMGNDKWRKELKGNVYQLAC
jgi:hypothetical protein